MISLAIAPCSIIEVNFASEEEQRHLGKAGGPARHLDPPVVVTRATIPTTFTPCANCRQLDTLSSVDGPLVLPGSNILDTILALVRIWDSGHVWTVATSLHEFTSCTSRRAVQPCRSCRTAVTISQHCLPLSHLGVASSFATPTCSSTLSSKSPVVTTTRQPHAAFFGVRTSGTTATDATPPRTDHPHHAAPRSRHPTLGRLHLHSASSTSLSLSQLTSTFAIDSSSVLLGLTPIHHDMVLVGGILPTLLRGATICHVNTRLSPFLIDSGGGTGVQRLAAAVAATHVALPPRVVPRLALSHPLPSCTHMICVGGQPLDWPTAQHLRKLRGDPTAQVRNILGAAECVLAVTDGKSVRDGGAAVRFWLGDKGRGVTSVESLHSSVDHESSKKGSNANANANANDASLSFVDLVSCGRLLPHLRSSLPPAHPHPLPLHLTTATTPPTSVTLPDLCFLLDDEIFVFGTETPLLLSPGGVSLHPWMVERALGPNRTGVALSPGKGQVGVIVLVERQPDEADDATGDPTLVAQLKAAAMPVPLLAVHVVPPRSLPITTSGKMRRVEAARRFFRQSAEQRRVAIVGGGVGGVAAAWALHQAKAAMGCAPTSGHTVLFERAAELGGRAATSLHDGLPHDLGGHICTQRYDTLHSLFVDQLGCRRTGVSPVVEADGVAPVDRVALGTAAAAFLAGRPACLGVVQGASLLPLSRLHPEWFERSAAEESTRLGLVPLLDALSSSLRATGIGDPAQAPFATFARALDLSASLSASPDANWTLAAGIGPALEQLAASLAPGLEVKKGEEIVSIAAESSGQPGKASLLFLTSASGAVHGPFDQVLVAAPLSTVVPLLTTFGPTTAWQQVAAQESVANMSTTVVRLDGLTNDHVGFFYPRRGGGRESTSPILSYHRRYRSSNIVLFYSAGLTLPDIAAFLASPQAPVSTLSLSKVVSHHPWPGHNSYFTSPSAHSLAHSLQGSGGVFLTWGGLSFDFMEAVAGHAIHVVRSYMEGRGDEDVFDGERRTVPEPGSLDDTWTPRVCEELVIRCIARVTDTTVQRLASASATADGGQLHLFADEPALDSSQATRFVALIRRAGPWQRLPHSAPYDNPTVASFAQALSTFAASGRYAGADARRPPFPTSVRLGVPGPPLFVPLDASSSSPEARARPCTLLLIPPAGMAGTDFYRPFSASLATCAHVLALDLPGRGINAPFAPLPPTFSTPQFQALVQYHLPRHQNVHRQPVVVFGHGEGVMVAVATAAMVSGSRVTLVASASPPPLSFVPHSDDCVDAAGAASSALSFDPLDVPLPEVAADRTLADALSRTLRPSLANVHVIVCGGARDRDPTPASLTASWSRVHAEHLSRSLTHWAPFDGGHMYLGGGKGQAQLIEALTRLVLDITKATKQHATVE